MIAAGSMLTGNVFSIPLSVTSLYCTEVVGVGSGQGGWLFLCTMHTDLALQLMGVRCDVCCYYIHTGPKYTHAQTGPIH